jgi:hypothetical protein
VENIMENLLWCNDKITAIWGRSPFFEERRRRTAGQMRLLDSEASPTQVVSCIPELAEFKVHNELVASNRCVAVPGA